MTLHYCAANISHPPTDQREWIGCRSCAIERFGASTGFLTPKHIPGGTPSQLASAFTYDPASHRLTFANSSGTVVLDSLEDYLAHWLEPSRCSLLWNTRHKKANAWVYEVDYGATGSGTTLLGALKSNLTGICIADAFGSNPHSFPVNAYGPSSSDLTAWPWRCACGSLAPPGKSQCLPCSS